MFETCATDVKVYDDDDDDEHKSTPYTIQATHTKMRVQGYSIRNLGVFWRQRQRETRREKYDTIILL